MTSIEIQTLCFPFTMSKPKTINLNDYKAMPEPRPRARLDQTNSRSHGEITRILGYRVYTMELFVPYRGAEPRMQELWWCCHGGTQVELLADDQQVELKPTSNQ